jgi:1-deoxy-D-xylulose-5-phosphate synthase
MSLLESIHSPQDIKAFTPAQRLQLAAELRRTIIQTVAKNGGHLATNLGTVELSIAVHTVFEAPQDQIVWDTGHQAYTHKLLTGRYPLFHTLRQRQGISGFLRRSESPYDSFGAGHAGTSVSAAAGMALARDILKSRERVVCIIGDSSIPSGMAFEALNHLGHAKPDLLLILNDNEMSISPPVGALSKYLSRIITGKMYNQARHEAGKWLKRLPGGLARHATDMAHHLEELVKSVASPGIFFEELGFNYVGPVDGHDVEALIAILGRIRDMKGPVLLHAVTRKGKGFEAAEKGPGGLPRGRQLRRGDRGTAQARRGAQAHLVGHLCRPTPGKGQAGSASGHHHPGHDRRLQPGPLPAGGARTLLRRGHRRGARRHHGRRHGHARPAAGGLHLFHLSSAGL